MTPRTRRGRGGQGGYDPRPRVRTREGRAMELTVLGWSQHRIAADLGVSQAAVSKILARVEGRRLGELTAVVDRQKVRHTLRLEHIIAEGLHAWEESKTDATTRRQRKTRGGASQAAATVSEMVAENRHGEPRYLEVVLKALADHRKLWGLDAPQKVDLRATRNPFEALDEGALRQEIDRQARLLGIGAPVAGDSANAGEKATDDDR